jgi:hypothetical protein
MSDLLNTETGRAAILTAQRFLLQRRMSKYFKRNLVIDYNQWLSTGEFTLSTLLGSLNKAHDPEILNLFSLLGMTGGLPASVSAQTIYVDPVAGSDTTGAGTAAKPWASLWFLDYLPRKINHSYKILLVSSASIVSDVVLDFEFGPEGSLSFVGVGAPTVVAGPFTIATTGAIGANVGRFIQMTGPIGADPSNNFVMATSGAESGNVQAIHSLAAADTLAVLEGALSGLGAADTMNIVRPTVKLSVRNLVCSCRNGDSYASNINDGARLNFVNLQLEITNSGNTKVQSLLINNTCAQSMTFVQVIPPDAGTCVIRSDLNTQNPHDSIVESDSGSGVLNIIDTGTTPNPAGMTISDIGKDYPVIAEGGKIQWTSTRGRIDWRKNAELRNVSAEWINAYSSFAQCYKVLLQGTTPGDGSGGALEANSCKLSIRGLIAFNSDNIVTIRNNSDITIWESGADPTYSTITGYAFWFGGIGRVELQDDGALLVGTTNIINFNTVTPAIPAALPAVGLMETDAQLSMVKRLGT